MMNDSGQPGLIPLRSNSLENLYKLAHSLEVWRSFLAVCMLFYSEALLSKLSFFSVNYGVNL